jgi:N-acylneuraminate cytidylyltransferase
MKKAYRENGAFYITTKCALMESENRLSGKIGFHIMPYTRSFEIDEPTDLELIRAIYPNLRKSETENLTTRISNLKMILFDVDGCFTDGSVFLDQEGREMLRFSRIDGKGIELLRNAGYICGVVSSEQTEIVQKRMEKLDMKEIRLGISDKIAEVDRIRNQYGLSWNQIAYCGDDVQDLKVINEVGLSFVPSNAQEIVKASADYISNFEGGGGFIRDVANLILSA